MKAKLKIKKKQTKQVQTKYGMKDKHSFLLESSKGEFWASCFANNTTADWQEGDVREMELDKKVVNNNTFWNIVVPKSQPMMEALKRIEDKLDQLLDNKIGLEEPSDDDLIDDVPELDNIDVDGTPDDDIPF